MSTPRLVKDASGHPIQVLSDDISVAPGIITVAGTSARVAIPAGAQVLRFAATTNCYYKWGDSTVTATSADRIMPASVEFKAVPLGVTHVAAIQVSSGGFLEIDAQV